MEFEKYRVLAICDVDFNFQLALKLKTMSAEELRRKSAIAVEECEHNERHAIDVSEISYKDFQLLIDILENDGLEPVEQNRNFLIVTKR